MSKCYVIWCGVKRRPEKDDAPNLMNSHFKLIKNPHRVGLGGYRDIHSRLWA